MTTNRKPTGTAVSIPAGLAAGSIVSLAVTCVSTAVLAKLVDSEKLPWENIGYGIAIMLMLSSFCGAMTAFRKIKRQRLMVCMASGGIYFAMLLSATALFFGGQYEAVGVTALLVLGGSLSAGLLGLRGGKGRPGSRKRSSHR